VLVEIHTPYFGERAGAQTAQALIDRGYRLIDQRGWTYAFLATEGMTIRTPRLLSTWSRAPSGRKLQPLHIRSKASLVGGRSR
jgi:hypothetical protein